MIEARLLGLIQVLGGHGRLPVTIYPSIGTVHHRPGPVGERLFCVAWDGGRLER